MFNQSTLSCFASPANSKPFTWCFATCVWLALAWFALAADNVLTDHEKHEGWILMFDGKNVDKWIAKGQPLPAATVQDGCINTFKQGEYVNHYDRIFRDFHFTCDFKFEAKCNSGIFIHGNKLGGNDINRGVEIQVFDSFGKEKPDKHDAGAVYDLLEPSKNAIKKPGEWNHIEILSKGSTLKIILNGETVIDTDFAKWTEPNKNPDGTKNKFKWAFKDQKPEGYIGLQDHGHPCWFKNLKVKEL